MDGHDPRYCPPSPAAQPRAPATAAHGVTIVVPCYNEARRLHPDTFLQYAARTPGVRFLFVDDGSTDGTAAMLRPLCAAAPCRFELVRSERNLGQGESVRAGVCRALARGDRYVGYWDADLAAPLDEIARLCAVLDKRPSCIAVLGSRRPVAEGRIERHVLRHLLGRLFAHVAATVLGLDVHDTQCGAKLFRNSKDVAAIFARPFISRWIFDVELLARLIRRRGSAAAARAVVCELPLRSWREVADSRLRPLDFARAPWEMARIARELHF